MKAALLAISLCTIAATAQAHGAPKSYAVLAYGSPTAEIVFVYSKIDFVCTAPILANLNEIQQQLVAPSLTKIGSGCVTRNRISNLNPPLCAVLDSSVDATFSVWEYGCYRGVAERLLVPPPTAADLARERQAQEAALSAQKQAEILAAQRAAERTAWQRYAVTWLHQQDRTACVQKWSNMPRAPREDSLVSQIAYFCDNPKRTVVDPALAVIRYCQYLRAAGQPASTIQAACDTTANTPFHIMPPSDVLIAMPRSIASTNDAKATVQLTPASIPARPPDANCLKYLAYLRATEQLHTAPDGDAISCQNVH